MRTKTPGRTSRPSFPAWGKRRRKQMKEIKNGDLVLSDLPAADGPFTAIVQFAQTFKGYEELGSFAQCAEVANQRRHDTLTELRACLFFEQRRARHTGESVDADEEAYQRDLVVQIRSKLIAGERT